MNDLNEVIKICNPFMLFLYKTLIFYIKYVNNTLKDKFDLNITSKFKSVTGPDDLFLLLI